jgi:hypothetical protein
MAQGCGSGAVADDGVPSKASHLKRPGLVTGFRSRGDGFARAIGSARSVRRGRTDPGDLCLRPFVEVGNDLPSQPFSRRIGAPAYP